MNRWSVALFTVVLAACEGEPPKTPEGTMSGARPGDVPVIVRDEPEAAPAVAPVSHGELPPCACSCPCAGGAAPAGGVAAPTPVAAPALSVPAPDGGSVAVVAAPSAAPAVAHAIISGLVTTTPKTSAGHAVVYLEDAPVEPTAKMTATVTNKMMSYVPYVSVVPVGGKVVFRNDEPFPHNVFSSDGERFNIGNLAQNEARVRVFKTPGSYALLCNLHPGMLGYVVVTPSSYYAKADLQGHFTIKDVPPGAYKITAWAPRLPPSTQSVTVKDGDVSANFDLHR